MQPSEVDALRTSAVTRALEELFRARLRAIPIGIGLIAAFSYFDDVAWRRITFACAALTMLGLTVVQAIRTKSLTAFQSVAAMAALQVIALFLTGGVDSPIFGMVPVVGVLGAVLLGRDMRVITRLQALAIGAMLLARTVWHVPMVPSFLGGDNAIAMSWVRGIAALLLTLSSAFVGRRIRDALGYVGEQALRARDDTLRTYGDQTQTLTTLAGEIAHELKNPLATISGLTTLVAREVDGKAAERMGVLKREADRMGGILEEFLNFSRPLVPLSLATTDLHDVCRDVATLHEGLALERGVAIRVGDRHARAMCDERKVKQILVNVLQNALAASPRGSAIEIAIGKKNGNATVTIKDRGPGLPDEIASRVFEPGVTSKKKGSGLGLTVSRMLARQHGGELDITSTENGCSVRLTIPETQEAAA